MLSVSANLKKENTLDPFGKQTSFLNLDSERISDLCLFQESIYIRLPYITHLIFCQQGAPNTFIQYIVLTRMTNEWI